MGEFILRIIVTMFSFMGLFAGIVLTIIGYSASKFITPILSKNSVETTANIISIDKNYNEYEYFDSEELNDIIDSFTVEDLVGRKQEKEKIWKNTFLIGCALVGLIFVYGIFNKIREKSFYDKSQVIFQQQELAQKRAERELQKSLEIEKTSSNNRNINNEGFSTVNPNLTNGSFDIRDNNKVKDDAPSFTTTKTNDLNFEKRKCPNCGKENEEYWAFCNYCGHKLDKND